MSEVPKFGERAGSLVNELYLSHAFDRLKSELPATLHRDPHKVVALLVATSRAAQTVEEGTNASASMAGAALRDGLNRLATAAGTMRQELLVLAGESPTFDVIDPYVAPPRLDSSKSPPKPDLAAVCSRLWNDLAFLEALAFDVAGKVVVRKEAKGAAERGQLLVRLVAEAYLRIYGALPPYAKESWFAQYMRVAGGAISVSCGPAPIAAAIKALRSSAS